MDKYNMALRLKWKQMARLSAWRSGFRFVRIDRVNNLRTGFDGW